MRIPTTTLGDFPIDEEDIRLSVTSNALVALDTLNPPSPVLTPSQLSFTWSSGEIPILLYDNAYLKHDGVRRSISSVNSESLELQRISTNLDMTSFADDVMASQEWRTTPVFSTQTTTDEITAIPPSSLSSFGSSATLSSAGTFGPRRVAAASAGWRRTTLIPTDSLHQNTLLSDETPHDAGTESDTVTICPSLPDDCLSQKRPLSILLEQITDNLECSSLSNQGEDHRDAPVDPDETFLASPTSTTLSWISSRDWTWQEYKDYISQETLTCYDRARPDSQVMSSLDITSPTKDHQRRSALQQQDINVPRSASLQPKFNTRPVLQVRQDQDSYPWLKDTTVQLMIDQEGFRGAEPLFKFASVGKLRTTHDTAKPLSTVMAQFRPSTRQTFHFHYAPFETPPILRRVIINADEGHDFVSRQAHLTLKNNGVYVVHGQEVSSDSESAGQKLYWQFEYFVDDRRVEHSGKVLEGEKVLIPLTFACSPKLLLSVQGKRVNIVQVFKKGVAPKIVAEKLQPPGTTVGRPSSAPENISVASKSSPSTTPTKSLRTSSPTKSLWTLHRRVQSHNIRQPDTPKPLSPTIVQQPSSKSPAFNHLPWFSPPFKGQHLSSSHRRAASASESTPEPTRTQPSKHRKSPTMNESPTSPPLPQTPKHRHIIPPCKLEDYVDTTSSDCRVDCVTLRKNTVVEPSNGFTPLTPRPRQTGKASDIARRSS